MARRGKHPPRVERYWHLLQEMQRRVDSGDAPNAAAVTVATEHWREIEGCKSYAACVQWLKDNERKFRDDLRKEQRAGCRLDTLEEILERLEKVRDEEAACGGPYYESEMLTRLAIATLKADQAEVPLLQHISNLARAGVIVDPPFRWRPPTARPKRPLRF